MNYQKLNDSLVKNGQELREIGLDNHVNGYFGWIKDLHEAGKSAGSIAKMLCDIAGYEISKRHNIARHLQQMNVYNPSDKYKPTGEKWEEIKKENKKEDMCTCCGIRKKKEGYRFLCSICSYDSDEFISNQVSVARSMHNTPLL